MIIITIPNNIMQCINFNNKELWPIWIGYIWFCLLITLRVFGEIGPIDLKSWSTFDDLRLQLVPYSATLCCLIVFTLITVSVSHFCLKQKINYPFYILIFVILFCSKIIGSFTILKKLGLGTSFWCIILGCFIRIIWRDAEHYIKRLMPMEFFIKTGIVLFAIDIQEILKLGSRGIVVAWVETILLLSLVYCIGIYIVRLDKTRTLLISFGLSICGSSAIMAISDIIESEQEHTNASITISSLFTIPFINGIPAISRIYGLSSVVSGIWIGGTVDSTGAVIASASLLDKTALNSAVVLKMLQNIIIGPILLVVTSFWYKSIKPSILWERFPKFVIGFLSICIIVSLLQNNLREMITQDCFIVSEWFSNISFILIGLDIDLYILKRLIIKNWKMILLYTIGQTIDVFTTLGFTLLMFT